MANLIKHKSMSQGCKAPLPYNNIRHGGLGQFDVQGGCIPLYWHWGLELWLTAQMFDIVTRAILTLNHQHIETWAEWQMFYQRHLDRQRIFFRILKKIAKKISQGSHQQLVITVQWMPWLEPNDNKMHENSKACTYHQFILNKNVSFLVQCHWTTHNLSLCLPNTVIAQ